METNSTLHTLQTESVLSLTHTAHISDLSQDKYRVNRMSEGGGKETTTTMMTTMMKMKRNAVADGRLEVLQIYKLLQLVREGNKAQVEKMVYLGVPNLINLTEPSEGSGVLHLTSVSNNLDMAEFLLNLGAQPDVQDKRGRTPVILAAELGNDAMLNLLAKSHADMKLLDVEGRGVLFYCISPSQRHSRCLQVAINSKADVNNVSTAGKPVFLLACEQANECENICIRMLESGADPNATDRLTGRTALMEAARSGSVVLVRLILQRGGNPNSVDEHQQNAAQLAAAGGFFQVLCVLSAYQADWSLVCVEGNSALHMSAAGGHTDCCRFLAQRGCNPKLKNRVGLVPRQLAKAHGHKAAMKELQKAERMFTKFTKPGVVNPNHLWALTLHDWSSEHEEVLRKAFQLSEESDTPVEKVSTEKFAYVLQEHHAPVDQEHLEKIIADHNNKHDGMINIADFFKGLQYLQKAFVLSSYEPKMKKKKKKGGKAGKGGKGNRKKGMSVVPLPICTLPPDIIDKRPDGGPQYMIESYQPFTDTKRFDRDHPPAHPVEDDSAWYVDQPQKIYININRCVRTEDFESLCLAFSQRLPVDIRDRFYKTPLMAACSSGSYDMAEFLITLGADVNACDQFKWTPLHHACHAGQQDIVELLVRHGAVVDAVALNGATPLMKAIESCRLSSVHQLITSNADVKATNHKGQSCLDIARVYGDERIIDLITTKFHSHPKSRDNKKGKGGKVRSEPQKAASPAGEAKPILPDVNEKRVNLKEYIITVNQNVNISSNTQSTHFIPKTVWGTRLATSAQHVERKVNRRNRLSYEVDFSDFVMPFNKNLVRKLTEVGVAEDEERNKTILKY
ncbi:ankyrin repeat and EF-hand domain-containing protein 1 isoform X2 [Tachysurus vachellii]|uniref:ankyrin repeat and EF-hand domain-containing protein 1 isoform X2 n=1 Tax=Tachysurus vachellii TaxID=175792 RepID=UPI00296AB8BD|nr:ankyrin repeat and EF-hand domain-containing protein 1 isoform X2 [Tachysurus vachellii]